jgi:DNA-binding GntR family transcriptional regulator
MLGTVSGATFRRDVIARLGRVPSVRTLAQEYGASTRTAERALGVLKDEGVLTVVLGKGFYVTKPQAK